MSKKETILKYLNGELSGEELAQFKRTDDYRLITSLDQTLKSFKAPQKELSAFEYKEYTNTPSKRRYLHIAVKIAAVLVIVSSLVLYFLPENTTVVTSKQESKVVLLPDESEVIMNAGTTIRYARDNWDDQRKVQLSGEAFFRVAKGQKFDVITQNGLISVLGTQFNVSDRKSQLLVTCYEGTVQVQSPNETTILIPGQSVQWTKDQFLKWDEQIGDIPGWIKGESKFRSTPFHIVLREFERQFNVSLETKRINEDQLFTGVFSHDDLESALMAITIPFNISYSIEEDKIILFKQQTP